MYRNVLFSLVVTSSRPAGYYACQGAEREMAEDFI